MSSTNDFGFSIDLTVRNEWKNVDLLRTSVQNCFIAVFADLDGCHTIAMVTGELLENALKYGDWARDKRAMFRLRVEGGSGKILVSVQNPLDPKDPAATNLVNTIDWIGGFAKPEQAYRARMLAIAQDDSNMTSSSQLGLVRIAFEGNCRLAAVIDSGAVTVTATLEMGTT